MDRDEFFAQLDQLTPKEIEARVPSWDKEQLMLVQQYLEQRRTKPRQSDQLTQAATDATEMAMRANARATLSLIVSLCALLAAVTSAVVGFLGLQH
jgi:RNase adaptor protein for sRNA GlmZ degradation